MSLRAFQPTLNLVLHLGQLVDFPAVPCTMCGSGLPVCKVVESCTRLEARAHKFMLAHLTAGLF